MRNCCIHTDEMVYLGSKIAYDGKIVQEIKQGIALAKLLKVKTQITHIKKVTSQY